MSTDIPMDKLGDTEAEQLREGIKNTFDVLVGAVKAGLVLSATNREGHMATGGGMFVVSMGPAQKPAFLHMGYRFVDTAEGDTIMQPMSRVARGALKLLQTTVATPATCSAAEEIRKKGNIADVDGWDMLKGAPLPVTPTADPRALQPGIYKHYKGGMYYVRGVSKDSNNSASPDALRVEYLALVLKGDEGTAKGWYSRSFAEFTESIPTLDVEATREQGKQVLKMVPRFAYQGGGTTSPEMHLREDALREILQEKAHLRAQRTELQARNTEYHDQVVALKNRIKELEALGVGTEKGA